MDLVGYMAIEVALAIEVGLVMYHTQYYWYQ